MSNIEKLVAALREEAGAVSAIEWDIPICTSNHIREAAKMIERLVKERDTLLSNGADAVTALCAEINKLRDERDAAVACIPHACGFCKWYVEADEECVQKFPCDNISGINTGWEWRGVDDTEGKAD